MYEDDCDDACQVCGEYHETDEESCEQPHFTNLPTLERGELGRLLHTEDGETYRTNAASQPIDDWGAVIEPNNA